MITASGMKELKSIFAKSAILASLMYGHRQWHQQLFTCVYQKGDPGKFHNFRRETPDLSLVLAMLQALVL